MSRNRGVRGQGVAGTPVHLRALRQRVLLRTGRLFARTPDGRPGGTAVVTDTVLTVRSKGQDDERREYLVQCMIEAIADLGPARASLAEVAHRAALTKGAILYHFTNREELLDAVFATVAGRGARFIGERVAAADTPTARLRAYVEAFPAALLEAPKDIQAMIAVAAERGLAGDLTIQEMALAPIEAILRDGQRTGEFVDFPIRPVAMAIRSATESLPGLAASNPELDLTAHGHAVADFFERGVTGTAGPRG
jgi:AcrR family transcriptional regulator